MVLEEKVVKMKVEEMEVKEERKKERERKEEEVNWTHLVGTFGQRQIKFGDQANKQTNKQTNTNCGGQDKKHFYYHYN